MHNKCMGLYGNLAAACPADIILGSFSKSRRRRQRKRQQTKGNGSARAFGFPVHFFAVL